LADTVVTGDVTATVAGAEGLWGPYYIDTTTAVMVSIDGGKDSSFWRTTYAGVGWTKTQILSGSARHISVWFDRETPDDTGTLVHVLWMDTIDTDRILYISIDISDGLPGTQRTIDNTVTVHDSASNNRCGITKTRSGNLIAVWSTQVEIGAQKTSDAWATAGTTIANVYETDTEEDYCLLFPANTGDDNDAAALFWDRSADEISVKMYDDSANTFSANETTILSSMTDDATFTNMDGAVRHSDGLILGCAHSAPASAGDDLEVFTVNPNDIASPPIVTTAGVLTAVYTNQNQSAQCTIFVNQQTNHVFIMYLKGGVWTTTVDCVYHISTNNMESWGTEQAYSESAADDIRQIHAGRTVGDDGGFYQPVCFNHDLTDIFVNLVNDVAIASSTASPVISETDTITVAESINPNILIMPQVTD